MRKMGGWSEGGVGGWNEGWRWEGGVREGMGGWNEGGDGRVE